MPRTLNELQTLLKEQYQKQATIERLFYPENPLPLEKCFLELALIEERKASKPKENEESKTITAKGEQTLSGREYLLQEYERIPTVSRTVAMTELLTLSQEPKKRLYIEGAAGAGKSTLTRYLAYSYANNAGFLQDYEWVFLIRLRELTGDNYSGAKISLLDILQRECFGRVKGGIFNGTFSEEELKALGEALGKDPQKSTVYFRWI